jgi:hypothetical protein
MFRYCCTLSNTCEMVWFRVCIFVLCHYWNGPISSSRIRTCSTEKKYAKPVPTSVYMAHALTLRFFYFDLFNNILRNNQTIFLNLPKIFRQQTLAELQPSMSSRALSSCGIPLDSSSFSSTWLLLKYRLELLKCLLWMYPLSFLFTCYQLI